MNINKIREAAGKIWLNATSHGTEEPYSTLSKIILAELDKAQQPGKVITDERPWMNEWQRNMCKKSKAALIHEIEQERAYCDKLRNEATTGLTVEDVMEAFTQECRPPEIRAAVMRPRFRARLTAAIEAKHAKP